MSELTCGSCLQRKPQDAEHPWYAICSDCRNRIAELEAELASERGLSSIQRDALDSCSRRAEKAEAEVERLSLLAKKATPRTRLYNQATDRWEEVG